MAGRKQASRKRRQLHKTGKVSAVDEYHEVDHAVHHFEVGAEKTSDEPLEDLKKQRLNLKDRLAGMIREHESSALKTRSSFCGTKGIAGRP
ncbi:YdcH family protein [Marinobacter lacisalsi]|uniref:YdcH family protein n=1 Tax=Marinobacter lacisalsi TaxID=475979 RepID=A0ABV8QLG9_9GAMM